MSKNLKQILLPLLAVGIALTSGFILSARDSWERAAREKKADYLFVDALSLHPLDEQRSSFEFLKRAYELDTTQTAVGAELGRYLLPIAASHNDHAMFNRSLDLMRRHFVAKPEDLINSEYLGEIAYRLGKSDEMLTIYHAIDSLRPNVGSYSIRYIDALINSADSANIQKALERIDILERAEHPDAVLTYRRINAYLTMGDTISAISAATRLIEHTPLQATSYLLAADLLKEIGRADSALYYMEEAHRVDPDNEAAFDMLLDEYFVNDLDAFCDLAKQAIEHEEFDPMTREEIANDFYSLTTRENPDSTLFDKIFPTFARLVVKYPNERKLLFNYYPAINKCNRREECTKTINQMLANDPEDAYLWDMRIRNAIIYDEPYDSLQGAIDSALSYLPDNERVLEIARDAYLYKEEYDKALELLKRSIALADSTNTEEMSDLWGTYGDIIDKTEGIDSAMVYHERALDLNPNNFSVMNNMAYNLAINDRDLARAEELSRKAIIGDQDNATFLDTYAYIKFKQRDYSTARLYIDSAISKCKEEGEEYAEILEHAGDIYFMIGRPDEALEFWKKALDIEPDSEILKKKVEHKAYFYE